MVWMLYKKSTKLQAELSWLQVVFTIRFSWSNRAQSIIVWVQTENYQQINRSSEAMQLLSFCKWLASFISFTEFRLWPQISEPEKINRCMERSFTRRISKARVSKHIRYEVCEETCPLVVGFWVCSSLLYFAPSEQTIQKILDKGSVQEKWATSPQEDYIPHHGKGNQDRVHMLQDYMIHKLCREP